MDVETARTGRTRKLCGAATLAAVLLAWSLAAGARAAAPPTGDAGASIAAAPAGAVAGSVDAGSFQTCGVRANGTLACWGDNDTGQVTPPPGTFTAVSAGRLPHLRREGERHPRLLGLQRQRPGDPAAGHLHRGKRRRRHSCGVRTNGTVACWGRNAFGQANPPAAPSPR